MSKEASPTISSIEHQSNAPKINLTALAQTLLPLFDWRYPYIIWWQENHRVNISIQEISLWIQE